VAHALNPKHLGRLRSEGSQFKTNLGKKLERPYLNQHLDAKKCACHSSDRGSHKVQGSWYRWPGKSKTLYPPKHSERDPISKMLRAKRAECMAQAGEHMPKAGTKP
jgi:hypothetical protein